MNPDAPMTLFLRKDARFEADGAQAKVRENWDRMKIGLESDDLRGVAFTAVVTERQARALAAVLTGAANWLRDQRVQAEEKELKGQT